MDTLQIIVVIVLIVIGPGSGLYIAHRAAVRLVKKELNGAIEDILEIKMLLMTDHDVLVRIAHQVEGHDDEIGSLRESRHRHGNTITALDLRTTELERRTG